MKSLFANEEQLKKDEPNMVNISCAGTRSEVEPHRMKLPFRPYPVKPTAKIKKKTCSNSTSKPQQNPNLPPRISAPPQRISAKQPLPILPHPHIFPPYFCIQSKQ